MASGSMHADTGRVVLHLGPLLQKRSNHEFYEFCRLNRDLRIERTSVGDLIIMPPAEGGTGERNVKLTALFGAWVEEDGTGVGFDSSTGFTLPSGATRSPDLAWITRSRWEKLTPREREEFPSPCTPCTTRASLTRRARLASLALLIGIESAALGEEPDTDRSMAPRVIVEERVTTFAPAGNGAGPLWCYGAPLVVRDGGDVLVSVIETGRGVPPLSNTRWQLWRRQSGGWSVAAREESYRQREPCPLVLLGDGTILLSANPSTEPPGTQYGPCRPTIHRFAGARLDEKEAELAGTPEVPAWNGSPRFTDHSYRGFAADRQHREALLLHIDAETSAQHVAQRDAQGRWHDRGKIEFPIRAAYPQVALRDGAAHVLAIGDIVEPVAEWRALKREVTGSEWDYVFRRLFYTWAPDLVNAPFREPLEIASVEKTGGHIQNLDLHIGEDGTVHLLYLERPHLHAFLRDRYFPGAPMTRLLQHVTMRDGKVLARATLARTPSAESGLDPHYARFHVTPGGALHVIVAGTRVEGQGSEARSRFGNYLLSLKGSARPAEKRDAELREIPLAHPFRTFFTSVPRGGAQPSWTLDLFGATGEPNALRYAEVELRGDTGG